MHFSTFFTVPKGFLGRSWSRVPSPSRSERKAFPSVLPLRGKCVCQTSSRSYKPPGDHRCHLWNQSVSTSVKAMAGSVSSLGPPALDNTPGLAWKWIVEKLVLLPDFGISFTEEVISHVTDIEEPHCRPLLERVALRYLEEMVVTNQLDADAIPLLKVLTGQDLPGSTSKSSSVKERFNRELVLRVQTEAVLALLRKEMANGQKDWAGFASEIHNVFTEVETNPRLADRCRELVVLLKPRNQTQAIVASYFDKYPLNKLKNDLYTFIDEKKESSQATFLDQLAQDFLDGKVPAFKEVHFGEKIPTIAGTHGTHEHAGGAALADIAESFRNSVSTFHGGQQGKLKGKVCGEARTCPGKEGAQIVERDEEPSNVVEKGRCKRMLPTLEEESGNEKELLEEQKLSNEGNKKLKKIVVPPLSFVSPARLLRKRDISGKAITESSSSRAGLFPMGVLEHLKQTATQLRHEEIESSPKVLGSTPKKMRGTQAAGATSGFEGVKSQVEDRKRYVMPVNVESDDETQLVESLSSDDDAKSPSPVGGNPGKEQSFDSSKRPRQSFDIKKGSGSGCQQEMQPKEAPGKESMQTETHREEGKRKSFTRPLEAQRGYSNKEINRREIGSEQEAVPADTQETVGVELLELGSDGHEHLCHKCALDGELLSCDGCPIAMHHQCIELLGLKAHNSLINTWFCPVCSERKAAREAAEAEKAAVDAKEKLKAFMRESAKKRSLSGADLLPQHKGKKVNKQQNSTRYESGQFETKPESVLGKVLKSRRQSEEKPKLREVGLRESSAEPRGSLLVPPGSKASTHRDATPRPEDTENHDQETIPDATSTKRASRGEDTTEERDNHREALQANERILNATAPEEERNSFATDQELPGREEATKSVTNKIGAGKKYGIEQNTTIDKRRSSRSGGRQKERVVKTLPERNRISEVDGAQRRGEGTGKRELGTGNGAQGEVEADKHDGDLEEDNGGKAQGTRRAPFFSERRRIPGLRRKPLPWSRTEEDVLKEGVKRYSFKGSHGYQWKRILEFGHGTFDPSRTDVDLKDKWRNLMKGVS